MLRTRLLLNLLPFPVILLGVGAYAVVLFVRLAREIDRSVTMNYRTVMATQDMSLSLARMQSAVRLRVNSETDEAAQSFQRQVALFEGHLDRQRQSVSSDREQALTEELAQDFRLLHAKGAAIFTEENRSNRRRDYDREFYPASLAIQLRLDALRQSSQEAILATSDNAGRVVRQVSALMAAGILAGLVLSGYSGYRFARSILTPIQSLTRATRELAQGNLAPPVVVASRDELATLAGAFNEMAAQLQDFRRNTSAEILRLHRTMEATLASFPDPVYVLGPEGAIELRNPAAQALSHGLGLPEALPPPLDALIDGARLSGAPHLPNDFKEVICVWHDAQERFYLPRIMVMRDGNGGLMGVAAVLYDLTRFRLLDVTKTKLVATVSHELKTPLTGVRMALHLLLEESLGPLTSRQQDMLATARDDAERLLRILNDLLDLARLDEGGAELRRETVPAQQLLEQAVTEMAEPVSAAGLRLISESDRELPGIHVDTARIRHVFANLITNAIKHSPAGGRIVVRAVRTADGDAEFSVQDDGPGIPPEFHNRIFERFFRVPGQAKAKDGAGLGLSIAREIVLAHGGYLGVRNCPDRGSEFFFSLPPAELHNRADSTRAA